MDFIVYNFQLNLAGFFSDLLGLTVSSSILQQAQGPTLDGHNCRKITEQYCKHMVTSEASHMLFSSNWKISPMGHRLWLWYAECWKSIYIQFYWGRQGKIFYIFPILKYLSWTCTYLLSFLTVLIVFGFFFLVKYIHENLLFSYGISTLSSSPE